MPEALPPFAIYLAGALLVALLRGRARQAAALAVPLLAFASYLALPQGLHWQVQFLDFELVLGRVDARSLLFLNIFILLSFAGIVYLIRENRAMDLAGGLLYAGAATGAVLAGDLITLFFFWEMLTLGAALCLLAGRTPRSARAAYRYVLVHVCGGVIFLAGIAIHLAGGGSPAFDRIELSGLGASLIFLGFGVNCAWPVLGAWLPDTYPEASPGGIIFMATFTTKTAVYALERVFPGEPLLLGIGVAMALGAALYALLCDDLRRVLAYSLITQVGFMVAAIGLGTPLAANGVYAHAYCHILYKALLFMAIGSVLARAGTAKASELGGLWRAMPRTCALCCVGAASAMAVPLFGAFASKSLILGAAAKEGQGLIWLALLAASAAVVVHTGLRVPWAAFFAPTAQSPPGRPRPRVEEASLNQLLAMGFIAFLCVGAGALPGVFLYPMLPHPEASYQPYTVAHVTDQLALLAFGAMAFFLLRRFGLAAPERPGVVVGAEWYYRRGGPAFFRLMDRLWNGFNRWSSRFFLGRLLPALAAFFRRGPSLLMIVFLWPAWKIRGDSPEQIACNKALVLLRSERGAFPIGITACFAVLLLALLFFF